MRIRRRILPPVKPAFYQFVAIENYPVGHVQTVSEEFLDPFLCIQVDFYGDLSHHL